MTANFWPVNETGQQVGDSSLGRKMPKFAIQKHGIQAKEPSSDAVEFFCYILEAIWTFQQTDCITAPMAPRKVINDLVGKLNILTTHKLWVKNDEMPCVNDVNWDLPVTGTLSQP